MDHIQRIRKEEKRYHEACYENYRLFEEGSWLHKPVKTVIDSFCMLPLNEKIKVLDLGSGVGRNSIPIAQNMVDREGDVVCVDILESALEKLKQYSKQYGVENKIKAIQSDIGTYSMGTNEYDFIVAVSCLEHVDSEQTLDNVLSRIEAATKGNGINCLIVNSELEEIDIQTNENLNPLIEVNLSTTEMLNKLQQAYYGWKLLQSTIKPLSFQINRDNKAVLLKTNAVTYVVQKQ
ncbi:class I SAM-dependent methyltransferase [Alkalihalobacillus sp. LMS39]|uniref:class I SAM-dependent methyltransferase n=1 Tax=Alkalihalobacillus sp. LMS39 TaxID=2924032 RepID=UPI001FB22B0E|nr:class I SAM-dependent methyltransferase [Alkalihalobacillus sp. LMS39]UOE94645.1 class I SAM-dependent methyltransferase [Alkalihalobacillus sp. LMS39]